MITSYQLFCEAINLNDAKYYTKIWYKVGADKLHAEFFSKLSKGKPDTKYRLYYPFNSNSELDSDITDTTYSEIMRLLQRYGCTDIDYIGNKATDKYNRTVKITSTLAKLTRTDLLNQYNANLNRSNKSSSKSTDEYMIAISRHPVDLAGMSTGRGWTSCMDIEEGSNRHYVQSDIINGTLIAYIIKSSDLNIRNPIARCLIKPFVSVNLKELKNYTIYLPEMKTYGTLSENTQKDFLTFIKNWCVDNLNKDSVDGKYFKNPNLYNDNGFTEINKVTTLCKYFEDNYKIKDNTIIIDDYLDLKSANLKSLDTDGLKVIVYRYLDIRNNPLLTSLKGIENFDIKGNILADWKKITYITLKEILLYKNKKFIVRLDNNTVEFKYSLSLDYCGLKSLDTDGLKVIVNGNLDITNNPELTSLDGINNFVVADNIYADWHRIKDVTLRDMILYEFKSYYTMVDENTIETEYLDLRDRKITSLNTNGLKVIINRYLDLRDNPFLTSMDGIENFEVKGEIYNNNNL